MDILLIQPPLPANERHKRVLPLGLAYLASYLRDNIETISIEILDSHVLNIGYSQTIKEFSKKKRDVVGITFWTAQAPFAYALAGMIKKISPKTIIVFGGVHTTCCPEESAAFCDFCVLHEGEQTLTELVKCFIDGLSAYDIKGVAYFREGNFVKTPPRAFIDNLNKLPFPAWDLLHMEKYDTPLHVVGGKRIPIVGSRGCPFKCSFCASPYLWKQKVRWRSPENVVAEMKEVIAKYGIRQFHFWDDNLLMNKENIKGLCDEIIANKMDIKWVGLSRGSHIVAYPEILGLLKKSGCIGLEVGIESADPNTFINIHKGEELNNLEKACQLQKKHGIYPLYTYMSLNPGETINTYYAQAKFIDDILDGLPWCEFFHPLPFPVYVGQFCTPHVGTELRRDIKDMGVILANGLEEYNHHTINFIPNSLLDDIPNKTIDRLRDDDYIICVKAAWYWMYDLYPFKEPFYLQAAKRCGFLNFVYKFFLYCTGDLSVRKISEELSGYFGISLAKSMRYSVIIVMILSQLGVIRSAFFDTEAQIPLKTINLPDPHRTRRKYGFLRLISPIVRFWGMRYL
jgi:anaerobic magnesium-protoporphyrin IX monomethyl ester cyclase